MLTEKTHDSDRILPTRVWLLGDFEFDPEGAELWCTEHIYSGMVMLCKETKVESPIGLPIVIPPMVFCHPDDVDELAVMPGLKIPYQTLMKLQNVTMKKLNKMLGINDDISRED